MALVGYNSTMDGVNDCINTLAGLLKGVGKTTPITLLVFAVVS